MNLHAPDPMGRAAHKAALCVGRLERRLLLASGTETSREARYAFAREAFTQWRQLCQAMAAFEASAPHAAEEGYAYAERLKDVIEARR